MGIRVGKILRSVGAGSTDPLLAHLENGDIRDAVIKTKSNPQGMLSVVNEIVSYRLAVELSIPMPRSGIALIDSETDGGGLVTQDDLGSCFYSEYIPKAVIPNSAVVAEITEPLLFCKIILFDHLIYNKDRNHGNLLVTMNKNFKKLYVIDHTHVFKNQTVWDSFCFERGIFENDYLDSAMMDQNCYSIFFEKVQITKDQLEEASEILREECTPELFELAISGIPPDWVVPEEELRALKDYLMYRSEHFNDYCSLILDWERENYIWKK